jgi:lysozyme
MNLELLYKLLKHFEGCRLTPYRCPAGIWTCGWGSTGKDVFPGQKWTQAYADKRLEDDARKFAHGTVALCPTVLGDERKIAAIADFAYNLGLGALKGSTLRKKVNAKDWKAAQVQIKRWNKAGGVVLKGLTRRRAAEAELLE